MKLSFAKLAKSYGSTFEYLESTTSTNDIASDAKYMERDVVIAGSQSSGRGQRGNVWHSVAGENLTLSLILKPNFLAAEYQFMLSECVALAIADTLKSYELNPQIKWTNDIYIDGYKVAGVLIENSIMGPNLSKSIIGIGLNVNQRSFDPTLPNPTSLAVQCSKEFSILEVFTKLYDSIMARYQMLKELDFDTIMDDYHSILYRLNEPHTYFLPNGEQLIGTIRAVEPSGELVVEHEDGSIKEYLFKEIEYKIRG